MVGCSGRSKPCSLRDKTAGLYSRGDGSYRIGRFGRSWRGWVLTENQEVYHLLPNRRFCEGRSCVLGIHWLWERARGRVEEMVRKGKWLVSGMPKKRIKENNVVWIKKVNEGSQSSQDNLRRCQKTNSLQKNKNSRHAKLSKWNGNSNNSQTYKLQTNKTENDDLTSLPFLPFSDGASTSLERPALRPSHVWGCCDWGPSATRTRTHTHTHHGRRGERI